MAHRVPTFSKRSPQTATASCTASISATRKTNRLATFFVPRRLHRRWHLCIGDSKHLLPPLLKRLREIDLFHHDSLHTYEHMMWEYETAFPWLSPTGVLSSHDVNAILSLRRPFRPSPFAVFCEQHHLRAETSLNFGLAIKPEARRDKRPGRALASPVEESDYSVRRWGN